MRPGGQRIQNAAVLTDHWPLLGLSLTTERLRLRLATDDELAELAELAARGVHPPDEQPFLHVWTDGTPAELARGVVQRAWRRRGTWRPTDWKLDLTVFVDEHPVGVQELCARDFGVLREVYTTSWLGLAHHGRGIGVEMRAAVLHLAFAGLGATDASTLSFVDNPAPLAVSRRLGYRPDGIIRDARRGEAVVSERLRLTVADWNSVARPEVRIEGLEPCLPLFGLA